MIIKNVCVHYWQVGTSTGKAEINIAYLILFLVLQIRIYKMLIRIWSFENLDFF